MAICLELMIKTAIKPRQGQPRGRGHPPSNSDILQFLKQMDKKLNKLDSLEEKVRT